VSQNSTEFFPYLSSFLFPCKCLVFLHWRICSFCISASQILVAFPRRQAKTRDIESQNGLSWKGHLKSTWSNSPAMNRIMYSWVRLLRALSNLTLSVSRTGHLPSLWQPVPSSQYCYDIHVLYQNHVQNRLSSYRDGEVQKAKNQWRHCQVSVQPSWAPRCRAWWPLGQGGGQGGQHTGFCPHMCVESQHVNHSIKDPLYHVLFLSCLDYAITLMFCRQYEITTLAVSNQAHHRSYYECWDKDTIFSSIIHISQYIKVMHKIFINRFSPLWPVCKQTFCREEHGAVPPSLGVTLMQDVCKINSLFVWQKWLLDSPLTHQRMTAWGCHCLWFLVLDHGWVSDLFYLAGNPLRNSCGGFSLVMQKGNSLP